MNPSIVNGNDLGQPRGRIALVNGRVILPNEIVQNQAVIVEGTRILEISATNAQGDSVEKIDVGGRYIAPGLIDIHTHGARGHSFNEGTPEAFTVITKENARRGITSLLPTAATAPIPQLVQFLGTIREWMRAPQDGAQVLGAHLEGPYFSYEQRGAQDPQHLRTPDDGSLDTLLDYHDVIKIMSFAPELPGALDLTSRLVALGIVPAAGHSAARDEHILAAMQRGLRHTIHIWSGQSSTVRVGPWRKPGLLEATLTFDELTGEMIADNRHLPPTLIKLAYKCLGPDRLCIISDATNGAGLPEGTRFQMGDMEYDVHDGVAMLLDRTSFAGSTTLVSQMIPILATIVGIPLAEAVRMASLTPARLIGVDDRKGTITAGKDADIAIFEDDFTTWRTMVAGRWMYASESEVR